MTKSIKVVRQFIELIMYKKVLVCYFSVFVNNQEVNLYILLIFLYIF